MPNFEFVGIDNNGKTIKGSIDADSSQSAKQKMKENGIYLTQIKKKDSNSKKSEAGDTIVVTNKTKVKLKSLANMTRQLATLTKAQVPLPEALIAVKEQQEDPNFSEIIARIRDMVNEGSSLAKAMSGYPQIFSVIYISMVRAGENSGSFHIVLERLAFFIENSVRLKSKIVSSMVYPIILGIVAIAIVAGLLTFVVPQMTQMFEQQEKALPFITVALIGISSFVRSYYHVIAIMLAMFIFFFRKYIKTETGRYWFHKKLISLPLFGLTIKKIEVSRFSRTLSTLLSSGVDLIKALDIVKEVVGNVVISKAIEDAAIKVREGESLAKKLKEASCFPPIVNHMIAIGEKSGGKELEEMLANIANAYDLEVENQLISMTSIIEPVLIVFLGGFVAFIVVAILLPILEMSNI